MENQEKQRDIQLEEKTLKLFGLLQNVPEDLLERSEKKSPGVSEFLHKYQSTLVACIALLLIGAGFLGYRAWGTGNDSASFDVADLDAGTQNEAAMEEGLETNGNMEYVVENEVIADMFQEALKGTEGGSTAGDEVAEDEAEGAAASEESIGLSSKLSTLDVPEGYRYENITSSMSDEREVLVIRLAHTDGKYMELIITGGVAKYKEHMTVFDQNGKRLYLDEENASLLADESGVTYLEVYYESGTVVQYSGTGEVQEVYRVLESLQ